MHGSIIVVNRSIAAPAYEYIGNVTNGRPFYILLLGKYEAIADFAKTLRSTDSNSLLKDRSNLYLRRISKSKKYVYLWAKYS